MSTQDTLQLIPRVGFRTVALSAQTSENQHDDALRSGAHYSLAQRLAGLMADSKILSIAAAEGAYKGVGEDSFIVTIQRDYEDTLASLAHEEFGQESILSIRATGRAQFIYGHTGQREECGEIVPIARGNRHQYDGYTAIPALGACFTIA